MQERARRRSSWRRGYRDKLAEIRRRVDGVTTETDEELIIIILRTCSPDEVRSIDRALDLDWDLDGREQDELDKLKAG